VNPLFLHLVPLFALLIWSAVTDLRERKIRNWLTLTLMISGMFQSLTPSHVATPGMSVLGLLTGFGITFVLFALGAIGGGDVKLMAGVGAWVGPAGILAVFCIAAIIGMVIVLIQATVQGRLNTLLRNSALVAVNLAHLNELGIKHVSDTGRSARSVDRPLPYAVPVLLAVAALAFRSYVMHGS
jgi:prepilin peptidase CpaA